jgi:hypothetical protein
MSESGETRNFLDHYFLSVYNKLEADALLFNRKLPHAGMAGTENEAALASVIRDFLPPQFGVESPGLVIDRHGGVSKQCDIIIYDAMRFPRYFRKVFPVEVVHGIIEVKTQLTSTEAADALKNLEALFNLDFRPAMTPYWINRSERENIHADPPFGMIFGYRSDAKQFKTFDEWFPLQSCHRGLRCNLGPRYNEIRTVTVAALDKGVLKMETTNGYIQRLIPFADVGTDRAFAVQVGKHTIDIDPAKVLFLFLETLWNRVSDHSIHPGFDIRTYMSETMGTIVDYDAMERAGESDQPEEAGDGGMSEKI